MSNGWRRWTGWAAAAGALAVTTMHMACQQPHGGGETTFRLTHEVILPRVTRLGINLGQQNYYDSGQMMKNLLFRNPGFEGMVYRSIVHCARASVAVCLDRREGIAWPAGFWDGAGYEVLDGAAAGRTGSIRASGASEGGYAVTLDGAGAALGQNDWVALTKEFAGDPAAGWWTGLEGGARLEAERKDLSPETDGKQALRIEAGGAGQAAEVKSYFDSTEGRTFLRLRGHYRLSFRAKHLSGVKLLHVSLRRLAPGLRPYLTQDVVLRPGWQDYRLDFTANETEPVAGTVEVKLRVEGGELLLDDVDLERADGDAGNRTPFRDEVVETLKELRPGVLRLMSWETGLGSTAGNLLAPSGARLRTGYALWSSKAEDIPVGIPEFLRLCQEVGAEPWIVLPMGMSREEARLLAEYLTGGAATQGGAMRAREGEREPWSRRLGTIHLELGNEVWNGIFGGETMDAAAYGRRAQTIFHELRTTAGAEGARLDLAVGAQAANAWPNKEILGGAREANSLAIAPYLMHTVTRWGSDEELYGPLLAQPEEMSRAGIVAQAAGSAGGRQLAVYEVNLHSTEGAAPGAVLDRLTPSAAAGVAVAGHMLRMMRDHGVRSQMLFALPQFQFKRQDGTQVRLWGSVVEMGRESRKRPQFLAEELANRVIRGNLVRVEVAGENPLREQPAGNDQVKLSGMHELDGYGFEEGNWHGMVLFNYGLHQSRRVRIEGPGVRAGMQVNVWKMESPSPGANNEERVEVRLTEGRAEAGQLTLAPCSMTVVEWREEPGNPGGK
jgi:hypothetical protein